MGSVDSDIEHKRLIAHLNDHEVILTDTWNPLIFAIYHGLLEIVQYILNQRSQQLFYLLSDPFQSSEDELNNSNDAPENPIERPDTQFLQERTELFPLILCLILKDPNMLSLLWNQKFLWNKPIYMIILGNFVFETEDPQLIREYLLSDKTKQLFKQISLSEKQKFLQFVIKSMEHQIVRDNESEQEISQDNDDEDVKQELERILNIEMLSLPPYSLVNLTENLLPLNINSTCQNLLMLFEQYR